jgi:hypothetical protein
MAIIVDRHRGKRACCADCQGGAGLGFIPGRMHPGHALAKLGAAHRAGGLHKGLRRARQSGGLGDIDMSTFVVSQSTIDAESDAFDGRLNAFLLDYSAAAARLPPSYVQKVDDFVFRWRKIKDDFYFFQTSRLHDVINAEAEFNKFRDQFLGYGQTTAIAPATVTADGKTVRSDEIPPGTDWSSGIVSALKWGGVIAGGLVVLKVAHDTDVIGRIRRAFKPKESAPA